MIFFFWVDFIYRYCSNYYSEFAEPIELCDWCQSEQRNTRQGSSSKKSTPTNDTVITSRSEYSGDKIKQHDREENPEKGKSPTPSPRTATRRYKLLKDVMCWVRKKTNKNRDYVKKGFVFIVVAKTYLYKLFSECCLGFMNEFCLCYDFFPSKLLIK